MSSLTSGVAHMFTLAIKDTEAVASASMDIWHHACLFLHCQGPTY